MRGDDRQDGHLFSYVSPEQRVPAEHSLRAIRRMTDAALTQLSPRFERLYAATGRPSIPPEQLLRALLLQSLYSVRSERMLVKQLEYNLLFRWFVGLTMDDTVWTATTFTKNRERLLSGEIAAAFFAAIREQARDAGLLSDEHFTVDGTLLQAWASHKSFQPRDGAPTDPPDESGNPSMSFRGQKRSNATHASTTDPDAKLYRKGDGQTAVLAYLGHVLLDNRHGWWPTPASR
jgi:transposase